jgi:hypothetical protein
MSDIDLMKEELKNIIVTGTKDEIIQKYYEKVHKLAKKYGCKANNDNEDSWNNKDVISLEYEMEELEENNEGELIYKLIVNVCE